MPKLIGSQWQILHVKFLIALWRFKFHRVETTSLPWLSMMAILQIAADIIYGRFCLVFQVEVFEHLHLLNCAVYLSESDNSYATAAHVVIGING